MSIELKQFELRKTTIRTRMPFRYGIAKVTVAPYLLVFADFDVDGQAARGVAADILAPKWFTKDPNARLEAEWADMVSVIRRAAELSLTVGPQPSVYRWWRELLNCQMADVAIGQHPPLLKGFGVSLLERAAIDATCRRHQTVFHAALQSDLFETRLEEHHAEIGGAAPVDFLPNEPLDRVTVRHTIGLTDPLSPAEIAIQDQVGDGLPQALDQCVERYGLTYFKIKIPADISDARERLTAIATILEQTSVDYRFTLDGNELFQVPEQFRQFWSELSAAPAICQFLQRGLLLVEQPLHRDVALSDQARGVFAAWQDRPPLIIDESDCGIDSFSQALAAGYDGTSHKNCKGVFKGIANTCLVRLRNRTRPGRQLLISGEDLMNIGPVALLQDLAVGAALGLSHMERNGHHYVAGLQAFSESVQQRMLESHRDLYALGGRSPDDRWPRVAIRDGQVSLRSINDAPFGYAIDLKPADFDALTET